MTKKNVVKSVKTPKIVKPEIIKVGNQTLKVDTIYSSEKVSERPPFEKREYSNTPTESGDVRVIVLQDYKGMLNELYAGDIIDMPERRYKSLAFRGLVKLYTGKSEANKQR
jgi:hypothetical protein